MPIAIALAQINPTVGDLEGNASRIIAAAESARRQGCGLVVYPELCITGYPPEDLLLRRDFIAAAERALERVVRSIDDIAIVLITPWAIHESDVPEVVHQKSTAQAEVAQNKPAHVRCLHIMLGDLEAHGYTKACRK